MQVKDYGAQGTQLTGERAKCLLATVQPLVRERRVTRVRHDLAHELREEVTIDQLYEKVRIVKKKRINEQIHGPMATMQVTGEANARHDGERERDT